MMEREVFFVGGKNCRNNGQAKTTRRTQSGTKRKNGAAVRDKPRMQGTNKRLGGKLRESKIKKMKIGLKPTALNGQDR